MQCMIMHISLRLCHQVICHEERLDEGLLLLTQERNRLDIFQDFVVPSFLSKYIRLKCVE